MTLMLLCLGVHQAAAQARPPAADSSARDSLLQCAVRLAHDAGFRPTPTQRPGRIGLMRTNESPGARRLVDGMRLSVAPADSTGIVRVDVQVASFMVGNTGFDNEEVAPRTSLLALADTVRSHCRQATAPTR